MKHLLLHTRQGTPHGVFCDLNRQLATFEDTHCVRSVLPVPVVQGSDETFTGALLVAYDATTPSRD